MAEVRWIKIYTDMISNKKIKRIRKLPEGNNIVLIWVFLLAQAGECNKSGALYLTDALPFRVDDLAIEFDFEISIIQLALITLERFSMIEIFDEIIFIKNWNEYQNIEGMDKIREQTRLRNIKYRESQKQLLLSDVSVTSRDAIELDLEVDLELDKKKKIKKEIKDTKIMYAEYVSLLPEEYDKLLQEYGEDMTKECIDILNTYKGSTGKTYKSDYMTMTPKSWVPKRYLEEQSKKVTVINGGFKVKPSVTSKIQEMYQKALEDERREANGGY